MKTFANVSNELSLILVTHFQGNKLPFLKHWQKEKKVKYSRKRKNTPIGISSQGKLLEVEIHVQSQ